MSNPLPTLRGTSQQALYPFTRAIGFMTDVHVFWNGSEQRWAKRPPLHSFELPMEKLKQADKNSYLGAWWGAVKGRFDDTISLTIGGVTYSDLVLMEDQALFVNGSARLYGQVVKLRQTKNYPWTPPTYASSFPTFTAGWTAQAPFSQGSEYMTTLNDSAIGPRFSRAWYGAAVTNFPTGPLLSWKINFGLLIDADRVILENHFLGCLGRYKSFSFTDPLTGVTTSHVRYDMDTLAINYLTANQSQTSIVLRQTNGS